MLPRLRDFICIAFVLISVAVRGSASPVASKLLALVPERAQIVAGIEDPHNPESKGRLLLVTHSSNLDFNDWIALTGVDPHRQTDEVIEVAASSTEGELHEHLLLVAGQFDRERIFHAALQNGASMAEYHGQALLVVEPFVRERQQISASRWMAVLDDHTTIFGSPALVRQALDRYLNRLEPDPPLLKRLSRLHADVNSWNVLVMSAPMLARHVAPGQLHAAWTHILDGADELTIGIHYGSTDRIDFAVHAVSGQSVSHLAEFLTEPRILPADLATGMRPNLQDLSIEQTRVCGSFVVRGKQFNRWLASVYTRRSSASNSDSRP